MAQNRSEEPVLDSALRHATGEPAGNSSVSTRPFLARNVTTPEMVYGDVLLVKDVAVEDLDESDYWTASSNPYLVLAFAQQQAVSCVYEKVLDASWNGPFAFLMGSPGNEVNPPWPSTVGASTPCNKETKSSRTANEEPKEFKEKTKSSKNTPSESAPPTDLTGIGPAVCGAVSAAEAKENALCVMAFHHSVKHQDRLLGFVDIDVRAVERGQHVKETYFLKGCPGRKSTITLSMERYPLLSPTVQGVLVSMIHKERALSSWLLKQHSISLKQLLGLEPFVPASRDVTFEERAALEAKEKKELLMGGGETHANAALAHLIHLIRSRSLSALHAPGDRTLRKMTNVLWSQQAALTQDLPCRTLIITNIRCADRSLDRERVTNRLFVLLSEASDSNIKSLHLIPSLPFPLPSTDSDAHAEVPPGGTKKKRIPVLYRCI